MPDDFDAIRERQHRTEGRVIALEDDARIRARAFADMDRDVSDLKVQYGKQKQMLQAVGDTLSDHTMRLTRLEGKVDDHTQRLIRLETKVDGLETKVDGLETKVDGLETKVDGLETKVDGLQTEMTQVKTKLGLVHAGVDTIIGMLNKAS
jgi:chromosome segregation ATPase